MARKGALHDIIKSRGISTEFKEITVGKVVDTNDPQQMGRIRVACPFFGDLEKDPIANIPWATYVSPLAGTTFSPERGRGGDKTAGQVAYGMFNIPKIGSSVLIACIDADPRFRIWLGCVHDQFFPHTLPHGRYSYRTENTPEGPFSSSEDPIQPLYDSQTAAFTNTESGVEPRKSFEFRTRGADVSAAGLGNEFVDTKDSAISKLSDDVDVPYGKNEAGGEYLNTQGYHESRIAGKIVDATTDDVVYDPQTYSWTTPGFHSLSMQDNAENCRIRFRTTHGHQIIMDDTNERIYISTAGGKTWLEMDEVGNIDIYAEGNISMHAKKDMNFTAGGSFRVQAEDGIHISSPGEIRMHSSENELYLKSKKDMHLNTTDGAMFVFSKNDLKTKVDSGAMSIETASNVSIKSGGNVSLEATGDISNKATGSFFADAVASANILAVGTVLLTGSQVHLNGPPAAPASSADSVAKPDTKESFSTNRVPDHEPWARTMMDQDKSDGDTGNTQEPEFDYDSPDVGRKELGEPLVKRNPLWHR